MSESQSVVSDSLRSHGLYSPWNSLGQNTGVGSLSLLQGIFPTQGSIPGLLHCRQILYRLSHQENPNAGLLVHFAGERKEMTLGTKTVLVLSLRAQWLTLLVT